MFAAKETMTAYGTSALSNAELLAIMVGITEDQARGLLEYASENAGGLGRMEVRELMEADGIGGGKAAAIVAGLELFRRIAEDEASKARERVRDSQKIAEIVTEMTRFDEREHFIAFCLDSKLNIKSRHVISIGNVDSSPVHPREVFNPAIRNSASAVIVAHNHPSGDATPSAQDIEVTKRLKDAADIIGIKLLDHVVVGKGQFTSLKSEGYL